MPDQPNGAKVDQHIAWVPTSFQLALFFVVTFAATWVLFLPFVLGLVPWLSGDAQLLRALGIAAPSLTAFVLTALVAGRDGVRRLWRKGTHWRVGVGWYAFVLLVPGLALAASSVVAAVTGNPIGLANPTPEIAVEAVIVGLLAGLFEEFGWMGLAYPALQSRHGFVWAGVTMGVAVALWHVPFFLSPGTNQSASSFVFFLVELIAARTVFGWIYNGTGGSVLLAILFHGSWNAWGETFQTGPMVADAYGLTELAILAAIAVAAVLARRGASTQSGLADSSR